jgi:V8-like Glu-specific endopeptidase
MRKADQDREELSPGRRSRLRATLRGRLALGATLFAAAALPAAAQAAGAPKATTGNARDVSYASATLAGTVNPNGENTSYYFQYGPTRAYGSQTAIADAGSGTSTTQARLTITGLQPITVYHYRLVAVNASGVATGGDQTLKTDKVPLSLAILVSPNPVAFGGPVTVQGTLSGTGNANRAVVLQGNTFPFTAGFQTVGNAELTTATGSFSFTVPSLLAITQFRVLTTNAAVVSPIAGENVAVRVSSHVARTRRRGFARIYGTVTPAVDGAQIGILRIAQGRGILAGGTIARPLNATSSRFSRVVRVRKGAYRVLAKVAPGAVISAYGTPLLIR